MTEEKDINQAPASTQTFNLVADWLTIPEIAEQLCLKVTRVHQMIADRALLALRHPETGVRMVPELFIDQAGPLKALKGTITVLEHGGFNDQEAITWLFTEDTTLPGRPIDALIQGRKTEIRRRAAALAW